MTSPGTAPRGLYQEALSSVFENASRDKYFPSKVFKECLVFSLKTDASKALCSSLGFTSKTVRGPYGGQEPLRYLSLLSAEKEPQ